MTAWVAVEVRSRPNPVESIFPRCAPRLLKTEQRREMVRLSVFRAVLLWAILVEPCCVLSSDRVLSYVGRSSFLSNVDALADLVSARCQLPIAENKQPNSRETNKVPMLLLDLRRVQLPDAVGRILERKVGISVSISGIVIDIDIANISRRSSTSSTSSSGNGATRRLRGNWRILQQA